MGPSRPFAPVSWRVRSRRLTTADHTLIMGIVNTTPDSFSDGGTFFAGDRFDPAAAIAHGRALLAAGADIVDVGGESTRPGADPVDAATETARVVPVVAALAGDGAVVSVDTSKPEVAAAALDAGAEIVNDVTALGDPGMLRICAASGAGVVLMHMRGTPRTMQELPSYDDVVGEVSSFLFARGAAAGAAGIDPERICVDPGIGFGKTLDHNLDLLARLDALVGLGWPVLVGTSRKAFIGAVVEAAGGPAVAPAGRDPGTAATVALAVAAGAAVVRVHDVAAAVQAARVADAIVRRRQGR